MMIIYISTSKFPPQIWKTDILMISKEAAENWSEVLLFANQIDNVNYINGVKVISPYYFCGKNILWELMYIYNIIYYCKNNKITPDIIHIYNPFYFAFILNLACNILFPHARIIFDVRTWPLKTWLIKKINYFLITLWSLTAHKTIIISKNLLKNFFFLKKDSIEEVALWFEKEDIKNIDFDLEYREHRKYIYIWSIYPRRNIWELLKIFQIYLNDFPNDTLTILWWWDNNYLADLKEKYKSLNIVFLPEVSYSDVKAIIDKCDYWIAYIPQSDYFIDQPPLKTIEYLWRWLPTIGTNTNWNKQFITSENWMIFDESIDSFVKWLLLFRRTFYKYRKETIQKSVDQFSWSQIYKKIYWVYKS